MTGDCLAPESFPVRDCTYTRLDSEELTFIFHVHKYEAIAWIPEIPKDERG
jgi:hypothetical protein